MIIRTGFLLVALVSAITVGQINLCRARKRSSSIEKHEKARCRDEHVEKEHGKLEESNDEPGEEEEQINASREPNRPPKTDCKGHEFLVQERKWNEENEIDQLQKLVKEKEQRREDMELKLIELYFRREQQSVSKLQTQLKDKMAEIDMLRATVKKLQMERKRLYEEVKENQLAEKQLESAKLTILELQAKMEIDAGKMKGHLMELKEQVSGFHTEKTYRIGDKVDKKLKAMKELELKAIEMKRRNREVQLEKRELAVKLDVAQAKIAALSLMTEHKMLVRVEEEINRLKHGNNSLLEQVEKLHKNRFGVLEELVYQRWLNSCLRFELEDYSCPQPKRRRPNVRRKLRLLSPNESELALLNRSFNSTPSEISSAESDEPTNTTSSSRSQNIKSKKSGLIHNIKRWGRSRDDSGGSAQIRSLQSKAGLFRRFSMSSVPSSASGNRNNGDRNVTFPDGKNEVTHSNSPEMLLPRRARRVSFNDALNSVTYVYRPVQETSYHGLYAGESLRNDGSSVIVPEEKDEQQSARATGIPPSRELSNQDFDDTNIDPQVICNKEIARAECSSSGMPNVAPVTSNMVHPIASFIFILFLLIVYFTLCYIYRIR